MTDEKRSEDANAARARPAAPAREDEGEGRPDAPEPDFFEADEHDGWAPIRKRVEEPDPSR